MDEDKEKKKEQEKRTRAVLPVDPLPETEKEVPDESKDAEALSERGKEEALSQEDEILAAAERKAPGGGPDAEELRAVIGRQHRIDYVSDKAVSQSKGRSFMLWLTASPVRLIALSFAFMILAGALLLMLPLSSASGEATDFFTALFTSCSAVCVTGLVLVDTGTYWSAFGHVVLLCLIQVGGVGLITIIAAFFSLSKRKMNLKVLRAVQDSVGSDSADGVYKLVRRVLKITFFFEFTGGLILSLRYMKYMPAKEAFGCGMFQGVSAFCNAGFDLLGSRFGRYASLTGLGQDPVILFVSAFLLTFGGLGFVVWIELFDYRKTEKLSFHSKTVLKLTGGILLFGSLAFFLLENSNRAQGALGALPAYQRPQAAFFQAATLRTAGFNSIDQSGLHTASKLLACLIMFIGAGPVSTGGGMKVSTCAIVAASWKSNVRGNRRVYLFGHKITAQNVMRAFAIVFSGALIAALSTFILTLTERAALAAGDFSAVDLLYESLSALCTVGVTSLQTENLSFWGRLPILLSMYLGRIGPFSFALLIALRSQKEDEIVLPEGKTFVG